MVHQFVEILRGNHSGELGQVMRVSNDPFGIKYYVLTLEGHKLSLRESSIKVVVPQCLLEIGTEVYKAPSLKCFDGKVGVITSNHRLIGGFKVKWEGDDEDSPHRSSEIIATSFVKGFKNTFLKVKAEPKLVFEDGAFYVSGKIISQYFDQHKLLVTTDLTCVSTSNPRTPRDKDFVKVAVKLNLEEYKMNVIITTGIHTGKLGTVTGTVGKYSWVLVETEGNPRVRYLTDNLSPTVAIKDKSFYVAEVGGNRLVVEYEGQGKTFLDTKLNAYKQNQLQIISEIQL